MEAGRDNYKPATRNEWSEVKALRDAGSVFIKNNEEWPLNGGKDMSPDFSIRYSEAAAAFINASNGFYDAKAICRAKHSLR